MGGSHMGRDVGVGLMQPGLSEELRVVVRGVDLGLHFGFSPWLFFHAIKKCQHLQRKLREWKILVN